MRILLVTPYYSPGVGGTPRLFQGFVDDMNARGHQMEVLTYGTPMYEGCAQFDAAQSYPIHRVPAARHRGREILAIGRRLLGLAATRRYDLVFCGVAYPSALLAYAVRKLTGTPYVVYSHGEDATSVKNSPRKAALLGRALRGAGVVMVNSRFTRAEIGAFGYPEEDVIVIPPGIDPAPYEQASPARIAALRRDLGLEGKRVLLTVARLTSPRKGHDTVVRTLPALCREFPDLHYLIVGKGDQSALNALARTQGVADRVTIMDYVSDDDLHALYHLCDVHVMVSRFDPESREVEGFGIVYLEAAACGKPSVAGQEGGAGDAVENDVTGLTVPPASVPEVAAAVRALLTDPERAAEMGEAGRRRVHAEFHADALRRKMESAIAAVARPRAG